MKKIYHHYSLWEDWKAGLYDLSTEYSEIEQEELASKARDFLSDSELFYSIGLKVVHEWKYASEVNLSNRNRNRQAWLGQASCCYHLGIPERITKFGWNLMDLDKQKEANRVADLVIAIWEREHA